MHNVFIISYDTLRADYIFENAKFMTSLIQTYFPKAITISPQTRVSIAALLTGMHSLNNGVAGYEDVRGKSVLVKTSCATLAEILNLKYGYKTIGFSEWFFRHDLFPQQGFEWFFAGPGNVKHFIKRYQAISKPKFGFFHFANLHERLGQGATKKEYEKALRRSDMEFEKFWKTLNLNLDETIVVIMGDHGIRIDSQDKEKFYGITLKEETIRVFLNMIIPNLRPKVVQFLATNIDITPTILDILKIDCQKSDGISLIPYIAADIIENVEREVFLLTGGMVDSPLKPNLFAIRDDRFKVTFNKDTKLIEFFNISSGEEKVVVSPLGVEYMKKLLPYLHQWGIYPFGEKEFHEGSGLFIEKSEDKK